MSKWSDHVHKYAKKHQMTYKEAQMSKDCKEAYKKKNSKLSPRMNGLSDMYKRLITPKKSQSPRREITGKREKSFSGTTPLSIFNHLYKKDLIYIDNKVKDMKRNYILSGYFEDSIVYKPPEERMKESLTDKKNQAYAVELFDVADRIQGQVHYALQDGWVMFDPNGDWRRTNFSFTELVLLIEKFNTLLAKRGYTKLMIPRELIDTFKFKRS